MSRRPARIERLVRLHEFRQDEAGARLREAVAEQLRARRSHDEAVADVERVTALRPQVLVGGGVDLGRYEVILAMERAAQAQAEEAARLLAEGDARSDVAKRGLIDAATATRVSRQRSQRQRVAARAAEEKHTFDRMADLRVRAAERKHD
jgi:hypothetical protein